MKEVFVDFTGCVSYILVLYFISLNNIIEFIPTMIYYKVNLTNDLLWLELTYGCVYGGLSMVFQEFKRLMLLFFCFMSDNKT